MTTKKFPLYLAFKKNSDGDAHDIRFSTTKLELLSIKGKSKKIDSKVLAKDEKPDLSLSKKFSGMMSKFESSLSAFRPLIDFSETMFEVYYSTAVVKPIYQTAIEKLTSVDEDKGEQIFGVPWEEFHQTRHALKEVVELKEALKIIPSSTLLSLVATFDTFLSEIITLMLKSYPDKVSESESQIPLREILKMESFSQAIDHVINEKVERVMRGSHLEQVKFIEKNFSIEIVGKYKTLPDFLEVFERRNLVAHGGCCVNGIYLSNGKILAYNTSDLAIGDQLELSQEYLMNSADILTEFGILLIFSLWRQHAKDEISDAYLHLSDTCYGLIKIGRNSLAVKLLSYCLGHKNPRMPDVRKKTMTVNLANAYKNLGNEDECQKVLDGVDWSATTENFKICVASLKGDVGQLVSLMDLNFHSKLISKADYRDWPVFIWIKEEKKFQDKYEALYGEPFYESVAGANDDDVEAVPTNDDPVGNFE